ncbi:MAG: hypothetical protein WC621_00130 [Patescibacteria group bacterium]
MAQVKKVTKIKKTAISLEDFNNLTTGDIIIDGCNLEWLVVPKAALITIDAYQCLKPSCHPDTMIVIWHKGKLVDENHKIITELNTGEEQIKLAA